MITVKEFDEIVDELTEKMQYISTGLESLWQHVYHLETSVGNEETRSMLQDLSSRIERLQFDGYTNPAQCADKMRFHDLYDIVETNEKAKDLDKLIDYEHTLKSIKKIISRINL